jgi:hypothetical protein
METVVTSSCLLLPASACTGTVFQFAAPNSFTNAELVLVAFSLFFFPLRPLRTGVRDLVSVSVCLCLDSLYRSVFYCACIFDDLLLLLFFKAFVFPPAFLESLFFGMFVCVLIVCDLLVLRQGLLLLLLVLLVMLFCNPHAVVASRLWHQVLRGGEGFRRGRGRRRGELGVHHRDVVVAVPIA